MAMTCLETIQAYGLRSIGIGERLLPRSDFTLCQHFTLIGSGLIWNIYLGVLALLFGFFLANALALAKAAQSPWARKPAEWFIFVFRGSPLFIQFFLAHELLVLLPKAGINVLGITIETSWTTRAWAGALFVLFLNTAAYSAEIFYGALKSVPKGDVEAADAYGMTPRQVFRRVLVPQMWVYALPGLSNLWLILIKATPLLFLLGIQDIVYWARELGSAKTSGNNPYPHGDWRVFYFLALLVFYLAFTRVSEIFLSRLTRRLSHGQATLGGEQLRKAGA